MFNANTMGIIFPNVYDRFIPELTRDRLMASLPFACRYRMVDFLLSSMVNCGIDNIAVIARENYHSLMDHLGTGRAWDLSRKNGGLTIFPPYSQKTFGMTHGRIEGLASILSFIRDQKEKYVVMADTNVAANFNFKDIIKAHIDSGADVTAVYTKQELPDNLMKLMDPKKGLYYTMDIDDEGMIHSININSKKTGIVNFGINVYVIEREFLIDLIQEAAVNGHILFERDVLIPKLSKLKVFGYEYTDYYVRITSMKTYFDENMRLLDDENLDALFKGNPIYTKIRDDNPTRYIGDAKAENVMVADGCIIEGEVENSLLFRGVRIGKGAKVKNCILMQDTVVCDGASLDYVITDKKVTISENQSMKGTDSFPVFIAKGKIV